MEPDVVFLIADGCGIGTGFQDVLVIVGVCSAFIYRLRYAIVKYLINQLVISYYFPVGLRYYLLVHFGFNCCNFEGR